MADIRKIDPTKQTPKRNFGTGGPPKQERRSFGGFSEHIKEQAEREQAVKKK